VNQLQRDATEAMEDLATGGRDDVESVLIATQKADTAFRLLLQVRNKVLDAYEEVKQIRV
jgi:flagellar hook-basal body complex protein FliE